MADPTALTAAGLAEEFATGAISPIGATRICLAQVADLEAALNAFERVDHQGAAAAAEASAARWERGDQLGPLDGVPTVIKTSLEIQGWPTLRGSRHTDPELRATDDSPAVARLRAAGAVILGKTTAPEYGWKGVGDSPLTGITRNPWDFERTSGGSSAGSAAAVASGMAVLGVGTDGAGSVRIPAAFCGVFGFKPTFSLIPVHPPSTGATLAHIGPLTRTVTDAALMMEVMAHPDPREVYPVPGDDRPWLRSLDAGIAGLRVAYSADFGYVQVDSHIAAAVETAAEVLADLGADVTEADPGFGDPLPQFMDYWDGLLSQPLMGLDEEALELSDPGLVATTRRGRLMSADRFIKAERVRPQVSNAISALLTGFDALVSPLMPLTALPVGTDIPPGSGMEHWLEWSPFTFPMNLSRHPAASVPIGLHQDGLPMAMQIVGRHFEDRRVLQVAHAFERARPFPRWRRDGPD